jgi:cyclohexanecarboxylate-CoA ligase
MRPRLPFLRHSVVIGDGTGDVDFAEHFEGRPWPALPLEEADDDPDRIAVVMFTSGTSGSPKAALHT